MKTQAMLVLLLATLAAAPVGAQQRVNETFSSDPTGTVEISNVAGSVTVRGWDRSEVRVTGELGRGVERVDIDRNRRNVAIRVVLPRNSRNSGGAELQIWVPAGKSVSVTGVSADVSVDGVRGDVNARSTSGDVRVAGGPENVRAVSTSGDVVVNVDTQGQVTANSTSGDVRVEGTVRNGVNAESVSGDVSIRATTGEVRGKTVSGNVEVRGNVERISLSSVSGGARIDAGRARYAAVQTVSGNVVYAGQIPDGAAFDLKSHGGDIQVVVPRNVSADFDVRSFSGGIRSDLGGEVRRTSQHGPGRAFRHSVGGGGGLVRVQTFSGSVVLRAQ